MEKYTVTRHFRCTMEESLLIDEKAKREMKTPSAYLRDSALGRNVPAFDEKAMHLLKGLASNELKIGVNINQVARLCNTKKEVSLSDLKKMEEYLVSLMKGRREIIRTLEEMREK